jgi:Chaperone of endosialidase
VRGSRLEVLLLLGHHRFQFSNCRPLFLVPAVFLEKFVEQHRIDGFVADGLWFAFLVTRDQLRADLSHVLGDQTKGERLRRIVGGIDNTAIGVNTLYYNMTGNYNVALGYRAGQNVTTADYVIAIGAVGAANVSNTCFIGNIRDVQTQNADAIPVVIDSAGQLGTASSSAKFKKEIKPMDKASEAVLGLKPVTFDYKSDKTATPQFGLIAEEVAKVNPDLVVRDKNGEIYTVRYDAVNAMLLNEFLKEHKTVQDQGATIAELKQEIAALAAGLQKVSAQLEANKPAPQVVNNP